MQYIRRLLPIGVAKALERVSSAKDTTPDERLAKLEESNKALQEQNTMLQECLLEMSEIVYA